MMNQDVKAKWVAQLRELPNDMQGAGALKADDGKMCCLGVLTEIAVEEGVMSPGVLDHPEDNAYNYGGFLCYPPAQVKSWAGLDNANPITYIGARKYGHKTLAGVNDSAGANFDEIADLIDEEF